MTNHDSEVIRKLVYYYHFVSVIFVIKYVIKK